MYKELIEKLNETIEAINTLQTQLDGRSTPIEDFPEDGLHPETEKVIAQFMATEATIAKLDSLCTAWKIQYPTTPSIPLRWCIYEPDLLFLDRVFVAPLNNIGDVDPTDYTRSGIGIPCTDGSRIEIIIASRDGKPFRIERIEREFADK